MNVMNELDHWHELIKPASVDLVALYKKLTLDELSELQQAVTVPEIIKEACDVMVTARGAVLAAKGFDWVHNHFVCSMQDLIRGHDIDWMHALHMVNQSNFSKLILEDQISAAGNHFKDIGVQVSILPLGNGYWGAYSAIDQTVNGKEYPKDKLLKAHTYVAIDESKEWWL